jgi:hypothetical protein
MVSFLFYFIILATPKISADIVIKFTPQETELSIAYESLKRSVEEFDSFLEENDLEFTYENFGYLVDDQEIQKAVVNIVTTK